VQTLSLKSIEISGFQTIDLIFEEIPEKSNVSEKTGLEYVVEECRRKLGETE